MPDSPAVTALDDQLHAAGAHAARWLEETGRGSGVAVPEGQVVQWQRDAVTAMKAATAAGTLACCPHLRAALEPVVVHAEHPGMLLCRSCHAVAMVLGYQRLEGTGIRPPAQRYVCPVNGNYVWFQPFVGVPIPQCLDHAVVLVPG